MSLGFKLPKKYRHFRGEKIRETYPFLLYLDKQYSPEAMKDFILSTGLEPEFFLDFDNLSNFHLILDAMAYMLKIGRAQESDVRAVVEGGHDDIYWDHFGPDWRKLKDVRELLAAFVEEQPFFQTDFQLKLETNDAGKLVVSYLPEFHLKQFTTFLVPEVVEYHRLYRKLTLEHLAKQELGRTITAQAIEGASSSPLALRFVIHEEGAAP